MIASGQRRACKDRRRVLKIYFPLKERSLAFHLVESDLHIDVYTLNQSSSIICRYENVGRPAQGGLNRPLLDESLAFALGDQLVILVEAAVQQFDDAGIRA